MPSLSTVPPPPTPRRPTLGMKRDSSHIDDNNLPAATRKKSKVAFDQQVDVRIVDDWTSKSLDLVKEEVRLGIQRHVAPSDQADDRQYEKLVAVFSKKPSSSDAPNSRLLQKYLTALEGRVNALGECNALVMAVLRLSWLGRDDAFIATYTWFLRILAGAQTNYIPVILESLVSHFKGIPASEGRLPGEEPISKVSMLDRLHGVIQVLLKRVPSAGYVLTRRLRQMFPDDHSSTRAYLQYQKNLIRLANSVPELNDEIFAIITQRLVDIDLKVQRDLDELAEDEEDSLLRPETRSSATVELSDDSESESDSESDVPMTEAEEALQGLRLRVAKMDDTQDLLFEHYNEGIQPEDEPYKSPAFSQLLSHFDSFIMPTRSRHAQFLLFHFSQQSPQHVQAFTDHCREILIPNGPIAPRITACAYLASFVARGSHIPSDLVQQVFYDLCADLEKMRLKWEPLCTGPDRRTYAVYYGVAQALLYIFCFRWRDLVVRTFPLGLNGNTSEDDLLAEGHDLTWLPKVKDILNKNFNSALNPLRICSEAIVTEFAKISQHLRFLYVFSLLERNKRVRLGATFFSDSSNQDMLIGQREALSIGRRETAWDRKAGEAHHLLEAYFPFDPYHLPKSKRWVDGDYNDWVLPRGMKQDLEDDEYSVSDADFDSDDEDPAQDLPLGRLSCMDTLSVGSDTSSIGKGDLPVGGQLS